MKLPAKLAIKPGLRWSGSMRVVGEDDGGYLVDWDAEVVSIPERSTYRYVYDRCVLTRKQIIDWTGVDIGE